MKKLLLKKCGSCGATVKVIKDCKCGGCGIVCCGESMNIVKANSSDAAYEKHIPTYEINNGKLLVKVNHVMEEDHYIEWIALVNDNVEKFVYFKPGDEAVASFDETEGTVYSYCNKHELWENEIK